MKSKFVLSLIALFTSVAVSAQSNYQTWAGLAEPNHSVRQPGLTEPTTRGGLITFDDRASFDIAAGFQVMEDFEGGIADGITVCNEPLNSSSDDACFTPGDLINGFDVTSSGNGGLVVLTEGFIGQPTDVVGASSSSDFLIVNFANSNVIAVALDAFSGFPGAGLVTIRTFDAFGNTAGSIGVATQNAFLSEFVGFISPTPISRIEIQGAFDSSELFDNLAFGPPPVEVADSQPVPTLSLYGIVAAAILLMLIAGVALRRRSSI